MQAICPGFQGLCWRLATEWADILSPAHMKQFHPFNYLEIGALHGANLISFYRTYGGQEENKNDTYTIIDPFEDYGDYPEYQGEQQTNYNTFVHNIELAKLPHDQIIFYRDYSHRILPTLVDDTYHIIYIDGNHMPHAVLEDAVLCWRKLLRGGLLIFDDYGWGGPDCTQRGIDAFVHGYRDQIEKHFAYNGQYFIKKRFYSEGSAGSKENNEEDYDDEVSPWSSESDDSVS